jgi:crotonobetainyl-CoA:carnitine CoA-transferase CaiB-like acyl-CoA transferase
VRAKASPAAGQHTHAVLREYGFESDDIARLLASGAVGEETQSGRAKAAL